MPWTELLKKKHVLVTVKKVGVAPKWDMNFKKRRTLRAPSKSRPACKSIVENSQTRSEVLQTLFCSFLLFWGSVSLSCLYVSPYPRRPLHFCQSDWGNSSLLSLNCKTPSASVQSSQITPQSSDSLLLLLQSKTTSGGSVLKA